MQIIEYQHDYQDQVISLWEECGLVVPWNDPVKDIQRKLKRDSDLFLIGILEKDLVATVMGGYEGHRGWINYLAVKPGKQRLGYGRQIMACVENKIAALGCPKINLQVRSTNLEVIEFYEALGYKDDNVIGMGKRLLIDGGDSI